MNTSLSSSPGAVPPAALPLALSQRKLWIGGATALVAVGSLASALVIQRAPVQEHGGAAASPPAQAAALSPAPTAAAQSDGTRQVPSARHAAPTAPTAPPTAPAAQAAAPACAACGTVQSAQAVKKKGQATGVGAVAGGVLGGIVGNQFGKGQGRGAMTVIGAVGGGVAGHEIEKRQRATTVYEITVRMDDGQTRRFTRNEPWAVGQRVTVDGNALHSLRASPAPAQATAQAGG